MELEIDKITAILEEKGLMVIPKTQVAAFQGKRLGKNYTMVRDESGKRIRRLRKSVYIPGFGNIFKTRLNNRHKKILKETYSEEELRQLEVYL